eukprot:1255694-Amphidinium_carterae.1
MSTTMCHEKPAPMLDQWAPDDDCSRRSATCEGLFPGLCSVPAAPGALVHDSCLGLQIGCG